MKEENTLFINKILSLSNEVLSQNLIGNLQNYNDEMTISQVVRFFEKNGIELTKTMIQNYVRVNVLPPPLDKRNYTREHLIMLTLIYNLKDVYSLDEIKNLLRPILKDINTFDDDMIDIATIYEIYTKSYESSINDWKKELPVLINKISALVSNSNVKENDKPSVDYFMLILTLMIQSIATKQFAQVLIQEYNKEFLKGIDN